MSVFNYIALIIRQTEEVSLRCVIFTAISQFIDGQES